MANLSDIEGIGPMYAGKLSDAGLKTTDDLLREAGSASGRQSLAGKMDIDASRLLEWVNRADLMRINGIGSEYSDLLEASGVDTVKELATRSAANLHERMTEVNNAKNLVRRPPSSADVEKWVAEAKSLPPMVTY
jgi:predicted flap endonuclease-1-like 5' DNA nuclease